jgi:hypothetical protein
MTPKTSLDDFNALVRRAGLPLTPAQTEELHHAWFHIEGFLERIRKPGRGREAEPALTFQPEQGK